MLVQFYMMADYHTVGGIFQEAEGDGIPEDKDSSEACCRRRARITTWISTHTLWSEMRRIGSAGKMYDISMKRRRI
jgi:hypothetical protein